MGRPDTPPPQADLARPPAWVPHKERSPPELAHLIEKFNAIAVEFAIALEQTLNKARVARAFTAISARAEAHGLPDRDEKHEYAEKAAAIAMAAALAIDRRWELMLEMRNAAERAGIVFNNQL